MRTEWRPADDALSGLPDAEPPADAAGLDLRLAGERAADAGADPDAFGRLVAAGIAAVGSSADAETVRSVAVVAAWRAGAIGFRGDALARISHTLADDAPGPVAASLAAALALPVDALPGFVEGQRASPFHWPTTDGAPPLLAILGGFAGLGGPFVAAPEATGRRDDDGLPGIRTAEGWWLVEADAFGRRITACADPFTEADLGWTVGGSYFVEVPA